jgi:hypothetical protein
LLYLSNEGCNFLGGKEKSNMFKKEEEECNIQERRRRKMSAECSGIF